jgi:hypothetical protein
VIAMTRQVNARFERWITEAPGQWFCSNRRWPLAEDDAAARRHIRAGGVRPLALRHGAMDYVWHRRCRWFQDLVGSAGPSAGGLCRIGMGALPLIG